ncbi:two component, sigma54 specific, transcriptional regulator, Fis family [Candidatus Vecturithrix granuli]|uniref:Two component, sigma54 specific, transcriptional regulator, Fis family n=1 Tax=Vecturithrix granuli TaxID=1499967 RepID=A0A081BYL7_VECG1|nr:two component, sigma54 specific, transcriptional regulator, Fis family [Candidatus Vecturithrix granuli]
MSEEARKSILIVEDDENIRKQMKWALAKEYDVLMAGDRATALQLCQKHSPGVMTLDLGLPPDPNGSSEGLQTLQEVLQHNPKTKIIIITGNQERANARKAVESGAYDFQNKPVDIEELKIVLRRAYNLYALEEENARLREQREQKNAFEDIIGESTRMKRLFSMIERIATTDISVLITGESGVGKELVAKAIHDRSLRKDFPFIPINCAAIPETLLESELFGHEKGAFTDAYTRKIGKVELADKGTLFLDEMGELGQPLQAKLLRFLQDQMIERVGGKNPIQVDVRVIAATNRNLEENIRQGLFREDLFFRLNEIHIHVPPLRERENDAQVLAKKFLDEFARETNRPIKGFTQNAQQLISDYAWPGNVRELRSRIKRAVVMADAALIKPEDLDLRAKSTPITLKEARDQIECKLIREALDRNNGNVSQAAKELEVTRPTLHDLMKKHNLSKDKF